MFRAVRWLLLVLSVMLALICIAGLVFVKVWLDPLLKERLQENTARSSHGMYTLQIDRLHADVFSGTMEADGIQLSTDSLRWDSICLTTPNETPLNITLHIVQIRLYNFEWISFWRTKDLRLDEVQIIDPQLNLVSVKDTGLVKRPGTDPPDKCFLERLPLLIVPHAKSIQLGSVTVFNGKISYCTRDGKQSGYQQADSIRLALSNVYLIANDTSETGKALYSEQILLRFNNYEYHPVDQLYACRIKSVAINGNDGSVKLEETSILPTITDKEFRKRSKLRVPRLKIRMKEILIGKLDLFRVMHKQECTMERVTVENARIKVYQNKNRPLSRHKKMPHELFRAIQTYLNIDTILLRNSNILYTELLGDHTGQLEFKHVNAVILNVTNAPLKMSDATPARLYARARLMGAGLLDLSIQLPLLSSNFRCDYTANLGHTDLTCLNRLVTLKNNFQIESGMVENVFLKVQVRNGLAKGSIQAIYSNLKISILREKDGTKKKFMSMVANIILRGKNEHDQAIRPFKVGSIYYRREPTDGILRFVWRTAQMGLVETLVPGNISGGKMPD